MVLRSVVSFVWVGYPPCPRLKQPESVTYGVTSSVKYSFQMSCVQNIANKSFVLLYCLQKRNPGVIAGTFFYLLRIADWT
jgi:hypothetical protein